MGKSESLAQDLVAACVKTILIGVMAFVVMEYAKHVLEVYNKRRALVAFQNNTIESAISELKAGYTAHFGCAASVARFQQEDCATGLRSFRVELDVQDDLVSGILNEELGAFRTLASSIDALVHAHGSKLSSEALAKLSRSAKENLRSAINHLAGELR